MTKRIGVVGPSGRMGRAVLEDLVASSDLVCTAALSRAHRPYIGQSLRRALRIPSEVLITADWANEIDEKCDIVIDFSHPDTTVCIAQLCARYGTKLVTGTTGLLPKHQAHIVACAQKTAIVQAPSMSVAVQLLFKLVELATKQIGAQADIEVMDIHHREKVDAPSGTALHLGQLISACLGQPWPASEVLGHTGPRLQGKIGFSSIRGGKTMGENAVLFMQDNEVLEIRHRSFGRQHFSLGALAAARFLIHKNTGLFSMEDVVAETGYHSVAKSGL